jgi:hypothetical protein
MNLYENKEVKPRKSHHCFLCYLEIKKGQKCIFEKGLYEGEFFRRYSHKECSDKWVELNTDEYSRPDDPWLELGEFHGEEFNFEEHRKMISKKYGVY